MNKACSAELVDQQLVGRGRCSSEPLALAAVQADFHDKTTKDDEPFYIIRAGIR